MRKQNFKKNKKNPQSLPKKKQSSDTPNLIKINHTKLINVKSEFLTQKTPKILKIHALLKAKTKSTEKSKKKKQNFPKEPKKESKFK